MTAFEFGYPGATSVGRSGHPKPLIKSMQGDAWVGEQCVIHFDVQPHHAIDSTGHLSLRTSVSCSPLQMVSRRATMQLSTACRVLGVTAKMSHMHVALYYGSVVQHLIDER